MVDTFIKPAGFFNVYKPKGQTSFSVTRYLTKLLKTDRETFDHKLRHARREPRHPKSKKTSRKFKVGHAGTLDPLAQGVLLVCFGSATRLIPFVHRFEKSYRATFLLGYRSETNDTEKGIFSTNFEGEIERELLQEVLSNFQGEIEQVPPAYSAVKVAGRQAYRLAREGEDVQLAPKTVTIHDLSIIRFEFPEVELQIRCSSGTYIRSIGRDFGEALGCGAVMTDLKRTAVGEFTIEDAVPFLDISADNLHRHVLPSIRLVDRLPKIVCSDEEKERLLHGRTIAAQTGLKYSPDEEFAAVDSNDHLLAILSFDESARLFSPKQVLIGEDH